MYKNPALQSFGQDTVRIGEVPEPKPADPKPEYFVNGKGATREEYAQAYRNVPAIELLKSWQAQEQLVPGDLVMVRHPSRPNIHIVAYRIVKE